MKFIIRLILIFVAIFVLFFGCDAQQNQGLTEADLLLSPSELLDEELTGVGNSTILQQIGTENQVDITQKQRGDSKINLVKVLQSGDYNRIYIIQDGTGNQTAVIQRGSDNLYDLEVIGSGNNVAVIQDGDGNRIIQDLINTDEMNVEFVQIGSNNEIIQNLNGTNGLEFKIIQEGDGMQAIINQDGSN